MPKLRKPTRSNIFGRYSKFVELEYLTKGQAKRKLRNAGCGPMVVMGHDIEPEPDTFAKVWGRAFYVPGRGWVVHVEKK